MVVYELASSKTSGTGNSDTIFSVLGNMFMEQTPIRHGQPLGHAPSDKNQIEFMTIVDHTRHV